MKDSLQLACTHRYHRTCATKLQQELRYRCDICEIGKSKKMSIILMNNKGKMKK